MARAAGCASLLTELAPLHRGYNVYHSKHATVAALAAIQRAGLPWWTPACTSFVANVRCAPEYTKEARAPNKKPIIVVEGLDGVGKTTMTHALCAKLSGVLVRTPDPSLEPLRMLFRSLDEPLARAFYCGANYLAATTVVEAAARSPVVVDRWWCSTCAMTLAGKPGSTVAGLPPSTDAVYQWPEDLPRFDVGVLLHVDEEVRRLRMKKRNDENEEEALLAARAEMRDAAMEAYRRFGLLEPVEVPNYMTAVNSTLNLVQRTFAVPANAHFTVEDIASVKPY